MPDRKQHERAGKQQPPRSRTRGPARIAGRRWDHDTAGTGAADRIARAALICLTVGGVAICLYLWAAGHGHLALRCLAGDVILATILLLVM